MGNYFLDRYNEYAPLRAGRTLEPDAAEDRLARQANQWQEAGMCASKENSFN